MAQEKRSYSINSILLVAFLVVAILAVVYATSSRAAPVPGQTIPSGAIVPWLGNDPVPNGWCLLDGSDPGCGPDLSGLFLMGASKDGPRGKYAGDTLGTSLEGQHLPLLFLDKGVQGGPGDPAPDGTNKDVYYPEHAKTHVRGSLYRHFPMKKHNHKVNGQVPHYKVRFIKKT